MRLLVAHASKHGGTRGLADWLGEALTERGHDVTVSPTQDVGRLDDYEGVVVGGALYVFRWHSDARRFVRKHTKALRNRPVWLFSSGPLDDSATEKSIPPVRFVRKTAERISARGHMTFGGRLEPGVSDKLPTGDWRDREQVEDWAETIAADLDRLTVGS